jgi:hypothetical protein
VLGETPQLRSTVDEAAALELHTADVVGLVSDWDGLDVSSRFERLVVLLEQIGVWGILRILRMQHTAGTLPFSLPSLSTLMESFNVRNKNRKKNTLTVGARALAKHHHRGEVPSFHGHYGLLYFVPMLCA